MNFIFCFRPEDWQGGGICRPWVGYDDRHGCCQQGHGCHNNGSRLPDCRHTWETDWGSWLDCRLHCHPDWDYWLQEQQAKTNRNYLVQVGTSQGEEMFLPIIWIAHCISSLVIVLIWAVSWETLSFGFLSGTNQAIHYKWLDDWNFEIRP